MNVEKGEGQLKRNEIYREDIEEAMKYAKLLSKLSVLVPEEGEEADHKTLLIALTTALIVSYARSFINSRGGAGIDGGKIKKKLMNEYTEEECQTHEWVMLLRNKEFAHSEGEVHEMIIHYGHGNIGRTSRRTVPFTLEKTLVIEKMCKKVGSSLWDKGMSCVEHMLKKNPCNP